MKILKVRNVIPEEGQGEGGAVEGESKEGWCEPEEELEVGRWMLENRG